MTITTREPMDGAGAATNEGPGGSGDATPDTELIPVYSVATIGDLISTLLEYDGPSGRVRSPLLQEWIVPSGCCLLCTGCVFNNGYARVRMEGKADARQMGLHRLTYMVYHGDIPDGYVVHHTCANPNCINPCHLVAVTPQEHALLHKHNVTPCVPEILLLGGFTPQEIAAEYGISTDTVDRLVKARRPPMKISS